MFLQCFLRTIRKNGRILFMNSNIYSEILKSRNVSVTRARLRLLGLISSWTCPFSAKDLYERSADLPMDLATIYRNLSLFEKHGFIRMVSKIKREKYYASTSRNNPPHAHFLCSECGRLFCLRPFSLDDTKTLFGLVNREYHIEDVIVTFQGCCPDCLKQRDDLTGISLPGERKTS